MKGFKPIPRPFVPVRVLPVFVAAVLLSAFAPAASAGTSYNGTVVVGSPSELFWNACRIGALEGVSSNCVALDAHDPGRTIVEVWFEPDAVVLYWLCFYDADGRFLGCRVEGDLVPAKATRMAMSIPVGASDLDGISWRVDLELMVTCCI